MIALVRSTPAAAMQLGLVFGLPAAIEAALLACHAQGQGATDYVAMRATALDVYQSGRAPLAAGPTAAMPPAGAPSRKARGGKRAGCDAVSAGACA